ncbi:uncharacterized protein N7479_004904 [Penicillium vulpinum]|uniref:Uncharacterized protein n=1 Tax=Penicillium vulpinum TaxID=29845 RepID=A0A1V6RE85_9EURO|nr:uncharacterized protein N7479_004904 [Penicillium vulpinum]KAJ5965028.1 hypothetical protein N7479_004904 [Penicillium vulpinum]OQD99719.1 hypothetical protein PENVUL_c062G02925 [Penicillium vulpinum]
MKLTFIFLGLFAFLSRTVIAQVAGGSTYAHAFEAIYLYYGYLVDMEVTGKYGELGSTCIPTAGKSVCTVWEFIKSIQSRYNAAATGDGGRMGALTRPDDIPALADLLVEQNYNTYDSKRMFAETVPHSHVLLKVTDILTNARDKHPTVVSGGILAEAKETLMRVHAERAQDTLQAKREAFGIEFGRENMRHIVVDNVRMEGGVATYQDIDWDATAIAATEGTSYNAQSALDGYRDFTRHWTDHVEAMGDEEVIPDSTRIHLRILQSIHTQSDSLGSLAACRAI